MRLASIVAAGLALSSGCSALLGIDDHFSAPGAPDGPTAPDAPPTHRTGVFGHSSTTYHTELATMTVADDLSRLAIDAYTVDATGVHVFPGTGRSDGSFDIPDVPATDYYLRIADTGGGLPAIWHLQTHDLDLSRDQMGRPALPTLDAASPISLTAPAMRRYLSRDSVTAYSSLQASEVFPSWSSHRPDLGFDHLADATFDWAGHPALDDNGLWIVHHGLPSHVPAGFDVTTATEAAHVTGLHQQAGAALPLALAFAPGAAASASLEATIKLLRPQRTHLELLALLISATPDGGAGTFAGPQVLTATYQPDDHAPIHGSSVDYADPFPATWSRAALVSYSNLPRLFLRPPAIQRVLGDRITAIQVAAPGAALEIPTLVTRPPAPTGITLDGAPIHDAVHAADAALRLAWDAVPGATSYTVTLDVMTPQGSTTSYSLATSLPELVLPPATIPDQHRVAIWIGAALGDPLEPAIRRAPRQRTLSEHMAAVVLVSSTCGNGRVDPGEACDTGGESETCNVDCTVAMCGDAIVNAAAHEACDLGWADRTCDAQCHAVVCGDRVVSPGSDEQCDDGNTRDGDGCSADCYVESLTMCGNGVIDPGEQCDDGSTDNLDACTNQCKAARCGDGVVSAGEQCDDGNPIDGDGCSFLCQLERCGDGRVIYPEECDDGNPLPGDGCTPDCRRE